MKCPKCGETKKLGGMGGAGVKKNAVCMTCGHERFSDDGDTPRPLDEDNRIAALIAPDFKHLVLIMSIDSEPVGWVEYDAGQIDGLIRMLQRHREKLVQL